MFFEATYEKETILLLVVGLQEKLSEMQSMFSLNIIKIKEIVITKI